VAASDVVRVLGLKVLNTSCGCVMRDVARSCVESYGCGVAGPQDQRVAASKVFSELGLKVGQRYVIQQTVSSVSGIGGGGGSGSLRCSGCVFGELGLKGVRRCAC
jgi:hypothetical protein